VRLLFSTLLLALAWFTVANLAASIVVWCLARAGVGRGRSAGTLLCIRLLPFSIGVLVSAALFAPAHILLEPPAPRETFGLAVYAAALVALALVSASSVRVASVLRAERRLRIWVDSAVEMRCSKDTEAWEVSWLRGISLAGVLHPRVLVGRPARLALTATELDAAIAHELAHRRAHDNLKRFAMRCVPDLFGWTAAARRLEAAWQAASECAADGAAAVDEPRATALASALVKIARLGAETTGACSPAWSAFHEPGLLEARVRRLVGPIVRRDTRRHGIGLVAAVPVVAVGAWLAGAPAALHWLTELAIQRLP
jgi:beta-lactamase regulating signal transducer with metallopeptidase domain